MKRFKKIYIEITNVCNLSCSFCPKTKRSPGFMRLEAFRAILDEIKEYTDYVYFHVKGEPLLHPEIDKFLDSCCEKGFKANITTNGVLIEKAKDKLMGKPALRQINFSLHSFSGNEVDVSMEKYLNGIFTFIREAVNKSNVYIALRLWNLDQSNLINLERQRNREILDIIEKEFSLSYRIEEKIVPGRGIKISDRIFINQDYEFKWPDLNEDEGDKKGFCYGMRNQAAILVDGTVVPCCLDGEGIINLGNVYEASFAEIVDSERANNIFKGFSKHEAVEELCRKCGYMRRFGKA